MEHKVQVDAVHYSNLEYDTRSRFISYWHQISQVLKAEPKKVLEIGVGNGFVSDYLRKYGISVTTLDFDNNLKPDVHGSVLDLPFHESSYDTVTCFEVLEHIPYKEVPKALAQIYKVTSNRAIISIPDRTITYKLLFKLPIIKQKSFTLRIPKFLNKTHTFDGQHYWELGKKGFSVHSFEQLIKSSGFKIKESFQDFEVHSHHFFVLEK